MSTQAGPPLMHLDRMTDSTGLIQHAIYCLPRRESGYTTDDNARALRLCVRLWARRPSDRMLERAARYLSFLEHARCPVRGFHNFLSYQRDWMDAAGTGDCQGQAVLALAEVLATPLPRGFRELARELLVAVMPTLAELRSLRAQAYLVQAFVRLWKADVQDCQCLEPLARRGAEHLVECFQRSRRPGWTWFESRMTYANAVLPHALFDAAQRWPDEGFREVAELSFAFLDEATTAEGLFWPIGNRDWYAHTEPKSLYDQQPIEAATMASAALAGFELLGDIRFMEVFERARGWFHGANSLRQPLAEMHTGGCFDGLTPASPNENQGAESTLALLWTELSCRAAFPATPVHAPTTLTSPAFTHV